MHSRRMHGRTRASHRNAVAVPACSAPVRSWMPTGTDTHIRPSCVSRRCVCVCALSLSAFPAVWCHGLFTPPGAHASQKPTTSLPARRAPCICRPIDFSPPENGAVVRAASRCGPAGCHGAAVVADAVHSAGVRRRAVAERLPGEAADWGARRRRR